MRRVFLLLPLLFLLISLLIGGSLLVHGTSAHSFRGLTFSIQNVFDTRACATNSNATNCDGQLPVTTQGLPGVGSGACIDNHMKKFPQFFSTTTTPNEEVDLYWSPTCQSYFAYASTTRRNSMMTVKVIEHSGVVLAADGTHDEFFNSEQAVGPLKQQEAWSPLKWSPSGHISAQLILKDSQGNDITIDETPQYVNGIQQPFS